MCICFRFLLPTFVDFLWKPSHLMPPQLPSCFENHRRGKWLWSLLYRTLFLFDSSYSLINGINDFLVIWHYGYKIDLHRTRKANKPNLFSHSMYYSIFMHNNVILISWLNREYNNVARKFVQSKRSIILLSNKSIFRRLNVFPFTSIPIFAWDSFPRFTLCNLPFKAPVTNCFFITCSLLMSYDK